MNLSKLWEIVERGARHAAVQGVAKSQTRLHNRTTTTVVLGECSSIPVSPQILSASLLISESMRNEHRWLLQFSCEDVFEALLSKAKHGKKFDSYFFSKNIVTCLGLGFRRESYSRGHFPGKDNVLKFNCGDGCTTVTWRHWIQCKWYFNKAVKNDDKILEKSTLNNPVALQKRQFVAGILGRQCKQTVKELVSYPGK